MPDASLGGRDTHTSPITIRELLGEAIFLSLNAGTRMEVVRTIKAAIAILDAADRASAFRKWDVGEYRIVPDPVAGSPGAPQSNT